VEACFLTLNLVNKTTLPGSNIELRRSVVEFMHESGVHQILQYVYDIVKKVHVRYLISG